MWSFLSGNITDSDKTYGTVHGVTYLQLKTKTEWVELLHYGNFDIEVHCHNDRHKRAKISTVYSQRYETLALHNVNKSLSVGVSIVFRWGRDVTPLTLRT